MSAMQWIKGPLWIVLEDFIEERNTGNGDAIALSLYGKMEEIFGDCSRKVRLQRMLSPSQYNSFRIICGTVLRGNKSQPATVATNAHHPAGMLPDVLIAVAIPRATS
jgi:hypothetical protein